MHPPLDAARPTHRRPWPAWPQDRSPLLADALAAEQRERQALAEALHDHAIQNLLSARHDLQEAGETRAHPGAGPRRRRPGRDRRAAARGVFDLHPYVLEQAGLESALRSIARAGSGSRTPSTCASTCTTPARHPQEQLAFSAARELLVNVVRPAHANEPTLRLVGPTESLELAVADNGPGFPPEQLPERLAAGHIGLASQRVRVEAAGGRMHVDSAPGEGTRVVIHLP